jgi:UDP-N-acetylmuramyl pentapeptide phosphotransferase/UDP-N-acetylglucosamine-1-phosphate transferase
MEAGLGDLLFWGSLAAALVIAGVAAFPVNRWLLRRGKGHAAVHDTGVHGGPSPRVVGIIVVLAAVFGATVLIAEALG